MWFEPCVSLRGPARAVAISQDDPRILANFGELGTFCMRLPRRFAMTGLDALPFLGEMCGTWGLRKALSKWRWSLPEAATRRDSAEGRAELRQPATGRLLGTSRKSWCLLLHRSFIAILRVQLLAHKNRGPTGLGFGTPEGTRTPNPRNRNPMLYPLSHWRICMGYYNRLRRQSKAIF